MELSCGAWPPTMDDIQPVVPPGALAGVIVTSEQDSTHDASVTVAILPLKTHKSHGAAAEPSCQQHQADCTVAGSMQEQAARANSSSTTGVLAMPDSSNSRGAPQHAAGAPSPPPPASTTAGAPTEAPTPPATTTDGALPQATGMQACSAMPASVAPPASTAAEEAAVANTQEPQVDASAAQSPAHSPPQFPTWSPAQSPHPAVSMGSTATSSPSPQGGCSVASQSPVTAVSVGPIMSSSPSTQENCSPAPHAAAAAAADLELQAPAAALHSMLTQQPASPAAVAVCMAAASSQPAAALQEAFSIQQHAPGTCRTGTTPATQPHMDTTRSAALGLEAAAASTSLAGPQCPLSSAAISGSPQAPATPEDSEDPGDSELAAAVSPLLLAAPSEVRSPPPPAAGAQDSPQHSPQQHSPPPAVPGAECTSQHIIQGSNPSMQESPGPAPNSGAAAAPQVVKIAHRELVYYGPLVCSVCGALGHAANTCRTAFCTECCWFGHDAARCAEACSNCGHYHEAAPDGTCSTPFCQQCSLAGHTRAQCPHNQCSACGCFGHLPAACQASSVDSHTAAPVQAPSSPPASADAGCARDDSTQQGQQQQPQQRQAEKLPPPAMPEPAAASGQSDAAPSSTTAAAAAAAAPTASGWQSSKDAREEIERIKRLWAQQAAAEQEQEQHQQQAWAQHHRGKSWPAKSHCTADPSSTTGAAGEGSGTGQGSQQQHHQQTHADMAYEKGKAADSAAGQPQAAPPSQTPNMDPTEEKQRIKQLWQAEAAAAELKAAGRRQPHAQHARSPFAAPKGAFQQPGTAGSGCVGAEGAVHEQGQRGAKSWEGTAGQGNGAGSWDSSAQHGNGADSWEGRAELHPAADGWGATAGQKPGAYSWDSRAGQPAEAMVGAKRLAALHFAAAARDRAGAGHDRSPVGGAARAAPTAAPFQRRASAAGNDAVSQWEQSGACPAHRQSTESDYYTYTVTSDSIRTSTSSSLQPDRYSDLFSGAAVQQTAGQAAPTSTFSTAAGSAATANPIGAAYPARSSAADSYAHGHTGQPAHFHYTSGMHGSATSSAAAVAAGIVGEDSDDDVPPGFENISRPPGFEGREPPRAACIAAAGLADMPPGFEGRALRIQAALVSHPEVQQLSGVPPALVGQQQQPLQQTTSLGRDEQRLSMSLSQRFGQQPLQHSTSLGSSEHRLPLSQRLASRLGGQPVGETDWLDQPVHCTAVTAAHQAAAATAADAADRGSQQARRFLFVAGPVCRECGAAGHEEANCSTPLCERCNLFGHSEGTCATACSTCGWQHQGPLDRDCQHERCLECCLWGHHHTHCPASQCNRCQCWGHARELCPGYCRKCRTGGHTTEECTVRRCKLCNTTGHNTFQCPLQHIQDSLPSPPGDQHKPRDTHTALQQQQQQPPPQQQQWWPSAAVSTQDVRFMAGNAGQLGDGVGRDLSSQGPQPIMPQRKAAAAGSQDVRSTAYGLGQAGGEDLSSQVQQPGVRQQRRPAAAVQHVGTQDIRFVAQASGDNPHSQDPQPVVHQRRATAGFGSQDVRSMGQASGEGSHSRGPQPVMHQRSAAAVVGSQDVRLMKMGQSGEVHGLQYSRPSATHSMASGAGSSSSSSWEANGGVADTFTGGQCHPEMLKPETSAAPAAAPQGMRRGTGMLAKVKRADAAPAVPPAPASYTAAAPAAAEYGSPGDADDTGVPLDVDDAVDSDDSDYGYGFSRVRKAGKAKKAAAAASSALTNTYSTSRGISSSKTAGKLSTGRGSSSSSGGASPSAALLQPCSPDWMAALKRLLSVSAPNAIKWRAILPSGDRVGPFSSGDMIGWLAGAGRAPKGLGGADARALVADQGALLVCAIDGKSYNPQALPGVKFYKSLSTLLPAVAAGLVYSPVTKGDLTKGFPAPGWNEAPTSTTAAAAGDVDADAGPPARQLPTTSSSSSVSKPAGGKLAHWLNPAVESSSAPSKASGSTAAGSSSSKAGLQQLLGPGDVKWRAVMPSGDRLGLYTGKELLSWLAGGGSAPKGVSKEDAKEVKANPGSLKLCGIHAKDYNQQKLPGLRFYLPLDNLSAAVSAGMGYSPVTRADLAKGFPGPGWNVPS